MNWSKTFMFLWMCVSRCWSVWHEQVVHSRLKEIEPKFRTTLFFFGASSLAREAAAVSWSRCNKMCVCGRPSICLSVRVSEKDLPFSAESPFLEVGTFPMACYLGFGFTWTWASWEIGWYEKKKSIFSSLFPCFFFFTRIFHWSDQIPDFPIDAPSNWRSEIK